jgi:succinate dehydrogenase/fumarate reductase cytochrome b subunit
VASEPVVGERRAALDAALHTLLALVETHVMRAALSPARLAALVHALNVLRALFRDARLAEPVAPHVEAALRLAITGAHSWCFLVIICTSAGFGASVWNVRNSSNLLLSALLQRLFGVRRQRTNRPTACVTLNKRNRMGIACM